MFRRKSKLKFLKATVIFILYSLFFFATNYLVKFSVVSHAGNLVPVIYFNAEETFELKLLNNVFQQEKKASTTLS